MPPRSRHSRARSMASGVPIGITAAAWRGPPKACAMAWARRALHAALGDTPDVAVYAGPVVSAGEVELLPFLHEQAVSVTAHRFGTPDHLTEGVL